MRAKIRLKRLEEPVHLVAHVEHVFAPRQIIAEHHDVFQGGIHHLELVLDVFQALTGLFLMSIDTTLPLPSRSSSGVLHGESSNGCRPVSTGEEEDVDVAFRLEAAAPIHLFLMIMRPERTPFVFNLAFFASSIAFGLVAIPILP